jgi:D-alanine-D-alanine ligase
VEHGETPVVLLYNEDPEWSSDDKEEARSCVVLMTQGMSELGHAVTPLAVDQPDLAALLHGVEPREVLVLNWCEELPGVPRSDVAAARTLEALGFTYSGAPPEVLALSWDKGRVKRLLDRRGVPTPAWRLCRDARVDGWDLFPAIVKPAHEHCSVGLSPESVVLDARALRERVTWVLDVFHEAALVEDFIDGREFHVSLWGNGTIEMLPPAEMDFAAFADVRERLCTYDSKFCPGSRHYDQIQLRLPAPLAANEYEALERTARDAYRTLGCRDYARADIRLRDGVFYVLDVNPNPDLSPDASLACAAELAGYSYGQMGSRMAELAWHRHPRRRDDRRPPARRRARRPATSACRSSESVLPA